MSNLNDAYTAVYGTNAKVFLRSIGGNPDQIIRSLEEKFAEPNPLTDLFGVDHASDLKYVHRAILQEIERICFSAVSRETAVAIANSIGDLGSISLCTTIPELTFNDWAYANAWSNVNSDHQPIRRMGGCYE